MEMETSKKSLKILGTRVDQVLLEDSLEIARSKILNGEKCEQIVTPYSEFFVEARKNQKFQEVINKSFLSIPDGVGVVFAAKFLEESRSKKGKIQKVLVFLKDLVQIPFYRFMKKENFPIKERVSGVDFVKEMLVWLTKNNIPAFFLGAMPKIGEKAYENLKKEIPDLKVSGIYSGSPDENEKDKIVEMINNSRAKFLVVCFSPPKQEVWIDSVLDKLETVKIAIGAGGTLDFFSGKKKRAPKLFRRIGLEWLWRLMIEPKRIKRIWNATFVFLSMLLKESLNGKNSK